MAAGTDREAGGLVEVRRDDAAGRFLVLVDGTVAGFADYHDDEGVRTFPHTVVEPEFGGRGLAGRLVGVALDATRSDGLRVRPVCSFVAGYIDKFPEYSDLLV